MCNYLSEALGGLIILPIVGNMAATFVVTFLVLDGRSNHLERSLLCVCYVIIAYVQSPTY